MSTPLPPPAPHVIYVPVSAVKPRTNGLAVASLVLGLLYLAGIGSILAIVFGVKARHEIDSSAGWVTGRGMATAGIILGWCGVALLLLGGIAVAVA